MQPGFQLFGRSENNCLEAGPARGFCVTRQVVDEQKIFCGDFHLARRQFEYFFLGLAQAGFAGKDYNVEIIVYFSFSVDARVVGDRV